MQDIFQSNFLSGQAKPSSSPFELAQANGNHHFVDLFIAALFSFNKLKDGQIKMRGVYEASGQVCFFTNVLISTT
jgi:hypothetical protein